MQSIESRGARGLPAKELATKTAMVRSLHTFANNLELSVTNPDFWLDQLQVREAIFTEKGANHVAANHVEPSTDSQGRPRVDARGSTARCGWNHWMPWHLASQKWAYHRCRVRSRLVNQEVLVSRQWQSRNSISGW